MKTTTRTLAAAAAVLACFTACSLNKTDEVKREREIVFDAVASGNTKSDELALASSLYPEDTPFKVWACALPGTKSYAQYSAESSALIEGATAVHSEGSRWALPDRTLWPSDGERLSFFALSPASMEASFSKERGITVEGYDISEGLDLMYADATDLNAGSSDGAVKLPFRRALSLVRFKAAASLPEGSEITVKKLSLSGIATCGSFRSYPEARWSADKSSKTDIVLFEGSRTLAEAAADLGEGAYMIPQYAGTTISLLCDISSGTATLRDQLLTLDCELSWGSGKLCSYTLKVTQSLSFTAEKDL